MRRPPLTAPPRVLPLLPLALVATYVGLRALDVAAGVNFLVGLPGEDAMDEDDDLSGGVIALGLASDLALLVVSSLLLRWLVRRWVAAQPA